MPAYNEGPRIGSVIEVVTRSGLFDAIIAVDDGSRDDTWEAICSYPVTGLRHRENRGKAAALQTGLNAIPGADAVAFIDADLLGITPEHLQDLLEPIRAHPDKLMTVAQFIRAHPGIDAVQNWFSILNGQRVLSRRFIDELPDLTPLRFGVEVFMTRYARDLGPGHTTVPWPGASHVLKETKYGLIPGFVERMRMYKEVLGTYWCRYPRWARERFDIREGRENIPQLSERETRGDD